MSEPISKRTREQAALICAIASSGGVRMRHAGLRRMVWSTAYYDIARRLGIPIESQSYAVAVAAWADARNSFPDCPWHRECDAEAESLLRTGWTP